MYEYCTSLSIIYLFSQGFFNYNDDKLVTVTLMNDNTLTYCLKDDFTEVEITPQNFYRLTASAYR